jgi:LemA protein
MPNQVGHDVKVLVLLLNRFIVRFFICLYCFKLNTYNIQLITKLHKDLLLFIYHKKHFNMALWIIIGIIVILAFWIIGMYNGFVKAKIKIDNSWSDINVFLKKRFDLIPNLVNTVKGYAAHESLTLEKVVQARNAAAAVPSNDVQAAAQANQQLSGALRSLFAVAEAYPDLKANQNFLELQQALQNIETDLGNARRYYNATVRDYNTSIQQFPGVILANMTGFKPREFFELENKTEAQNVEVKF